MPRSAWLCVLLMVPQARAGEPIDAEYFEKRVRPVFAAHCDSCHDAKKEKGGLQLTSRAAALKGGDTGPAVVPGDPARSLLVQAVGYEGDVKMPPKGKLKPEEITALTDWVKAGA